MSEKKKTEETKTVYETTLKELGGTLPVGIVQNGTLIKGLDCKEYGWKEEEAIAKRKDSEDRVTSGRMTTIILSELLTCLGSHKNFQELSTTERSLIIGQMTMGDILYSYIWLRIQALGPEAAFPVVCPNCKKSFTFDADLQSTNIVVFTDAKELEWKYKLRKPLPFKTGEIDTVIVGPPLWSILERRQQDEDLSEGEIKLHLIKASVKGVKEGNAIIPLPENAFDGVSKYDMEMLSKVIGERSPGPEITLSCKCPRKGCRLEFDSALNWDFDFFFGASSLPAN